jgi:CubicO group peptidase (beta-lactamase class C family)
VGLPTALVVAAAPARAQSYDFSAATALLDAHLDDYAGGVYVEVFQGDTAIFGYQGGGTIGPETLLRLGSASKWLSSAVVLRLVEQEAFALDDRIGDALPIFDLYGKGAVTIRQCFAMKSGLYETVVDFETSPWITLEQAASLIAANSPIVFPPGSMLAYEGDGMEVVGRIAELASGLDWRTLAEAELAVPLALGSLDYGLFPVNPGVPGGARLVAADYQKFLRMILAGGVAADGSRYLAVESVREWLTNQTLGLPEYDSPWPPYPYPFGERPDYGHGSWILARDPASGRVEEVTSPGVFGTFPWIDVKRQLRGILAHDADHGFADTAYVDLALLDLLREAIDEVLVFRDGFELGDFAAWTDHRIYTVRIDYSLPIFAADFESGDTSTWGAPPQTSFVAWTYGLDFEGLQGEDWLFDEADGIFWVLMSHSQLPSRSARSRFRTARPTPGFSPLSTTAVATATSRSTGPRGADYLAPRPSTGSSRPRLANARAGVRGAS